MFSKRLFGILLPVLSINFVTASPTRSTCFGPIHWEECQDNAPGSTIQCASYRVPLDYARPEIGSATIALTRVPSPMTPRLGTIFQFQGGPGGSGTQLVKEIASGVARLADGLYDVVGWDPRGINQTSPKLTCGFQSLEEQQGFFNGTIINDGIEAHGNFTDESDLHRFFSTLNQTDSILRRFGQKCIEDNGSFLKYLGTTAVVRDIVSMADCLEGPDNPINYYGISYGTVIGTYLVNMFPKRVGRVVIDGVVDAVTWATEPTYKETIHFPLGFLNNRVILAVIHDADVALKGFTDLCAQAGPANCSFATPGATGASLFQDIGDLIDTAYDRHKAGLSTLSAIDVRAVIYSTLSNPTTWDQVLVPSLISIRNSLTNQSTTNITDIMSMKKALTLAKLMQTRPSTIDPSLQAALAIGVIPCLDSIDQGNVTTKQVYDEMVRITQTISPFFGEVIGTPLTLLFNCHLFPVRAVERFTGPFNAKLENPILVIGNKGDPKTPFQNAKKIADMLGPSAGLLEQDGFGHTSLAEVSECTLGVIATYLVTGQLPESGQVCSVSQTLFPPNGLPLAAAS
ncbi:hypothetical protein M422DRAFT_261837 [Sphaerobolus stellatus SS14]|uniref:Uncharacterized protein n=1 Tax=Sphaerobolus stellatus (strain SS14) TaxID=990650 RepID=A0A0C9V2M3_SPHS4|nr:hypothetical protein M422DRAFT_261837 [Sphaerobolus stellatus SS14]